MTKEDKRYCTILLFLSFFSFFPNLWVQSADLMEARNFISAREIIQSGNWLIPTLNGNLRFEKPPLPTWLTAGVMKLTGNMSNEFLLRIPVALVSVMLIFFIYHLVKTLTNKSFLSFMASFVALTTFMIIKTGNENSWDMYTYVFIFGAIDFIVSGMKNYRIRDFFIGGIFLGASILSKGPVAVYGMLIPFIIAYGYVYGWNEFKENYKGILITLGVGLLLPALWGGAVITQYKDIFLSVMNKEKNTWTTKHTQGIFYYLDYFIYGGIWIFFFAMGMIKKWSKERNEDKKFFDFAFIWNLLIILLLSLIKMKKKRYGIPIYMTSSLMTGAICSYYYNKTWDMLKKTDKILLKVQSFLLWGISLGIPVLLFTAGYLKGKISLSYVVMILVFLIPFWCWLYIERNNPRRMKCIILASGILMLLANNSSNWFIERELREKTDKAFPRITEIKKAPPKYRVYSKDFQIEDVWNVGRKIVPLEADTKLSDKLVYFGNEEPDKEIFKDYQIVEKQTYAKGEDHINLFYMNKMEDNNEDSSNRSSGIYRVTFNRGAAETRE